MKPVISMIVAVSDNGVIGDGYSMLWHLPDDFKWFKKNTLHKPVVMGRKTFESLGKPLVDRHNVVVTRNTSWHVSGVTVVHSLEEAIDLFPQEKEVMIIGGAQIYQQAFAITTQLYLTTVHGVFEGEARFPDFDKGEWTTIFKAFHPMDEKHAVSFTMEVLEKQ